MKKYAFIEYGGRVQSIETRCSGFTRDEAGPGELAIADIIHPDYVHRFVEVTEETGEAREGMLYSDGKFVADVDYTAFREVVGAVERGMNDAD